MILHVPLLYCDGQIIRIHEERGFAGVPEGSTAGTLCATYNDLDSVKAIFEANKGEIAGLILEPVVGNSGYIEPTQEFLEGLRSMCTEEGAVLCFDEVGICHCDVIRVASNCSWPKLHLT